MKKNILIFKICVLSLFIVNSMYIFLSLDNRDDNDINKIVEVINDDSDINNNKEIIDAYKNLYSNDEVVGEINIINTDYKKAIMQSDNNDYYLNHLEDKTSSYMGSIYLDFRVDIGNGSKLLIFGHNSSRIKMPFKILENYYDKNYYDMHKYIQIITNERTRFYEIYSVFVEVNDFSYMQTDFENEDDWFNHINNFKKKSMYDTGVELDKKDNIIILQTCSTHYDYRKYNKKYLLVVGKEIDIIK